MAGESARVEPLTTTRRLRRGLTLAVVALALALLLRAFVLQAFWIPTASMEPTLVPGDRVLVSKLATRVGGVQRGDVVVFEDPNPDPHAARSVLAAAWDWLTEGLGVSASAEKDFIKRVIALPGETIEIRQGVVFIDGKELNEPYVGRLADTRDYPKTTVPEDRLFVMGDNRPNSNDSRFSLGFIPEERVIGRAFVLVWPPSRIGWLH